jgi:shikimate 5-dehydrogenase
VDGIDVLVHQAIASLEIWLERPGLDDLFSPLREAALS